MSEIRPIRREHRGGRAESRLCVLVSARHPIERSLLTSAQGLEDNLLSSVGGRTHVHARNKKKKKEKKRQADKHTLLLGVLLQYISSPLSSV